MTTEKDRKDLEYHNQLHIVTKALAGVPVERSIKGKEVWEINKRDFDFVHYDYRAVEIMPPHRARLAAEILRAGLNGYKIEHQLRNSDDDEWHDKTGFFFNFENYRYRVK